MVLGPATSQFHKGPFWKGRKEKDYRQKINCQLHQILRYSPEPITQPYTYKKLTYICESCLLGPGQLLYKVVCFLFFDSVNRNEQPIMSR